MSDEGESLNVQESINTVARHIAFRIFDPERAMWEDYPEIGEDDWERVVAAMEALTPIPPDTHEYWSSYDYLAGRVPRGRGGTGCVDASGCRVHRRISR